MEVIGTRIYKFYRVETGNQLDVRVINGNVGRTVRKNNDREASHRSGPLGG